MPIEMLSYAQLGERLHCSPDAARALVKRLRLPRQKANDGKVLVSVDLSEINHKPMPTRSTAAHHPITAALKARIEVLEAELAKLEALAVGHRVDFERERERFDGLMAELLRSTRDAQTAKEIGCSTRRRTRGATVPLMVALDRSSSEPSTPRSEARHSSSVVSGGLCAG